MPVTIRDRDPQPRVLAIHVGWWRFRPAVGRCNRRIRRSRILRPARGHRQLAGPLRLLIRLIRTGTGGIGLRRDFIHGLINRGGIHQRRLHALAVNPVRTILGTLTGDEILACRGRNAHGTGLVGLLRRCQTYGLQAERKRQRFVVRVDFDMLGHDLPP